MRPTLLCALLALLFLGACGSGGNGQSPSGGSTSTPPHGTTIPPITTGVVLEMYSETTGSVYDSTHKYLFVCVMNLNRVDVFSTVDFHLVASIPVPAPTGIDIWPDNTRIVTGSMTPNLFVIDTSSLQIVKTAPVPAQGTVNPQVFFPTILSQSSNGNTLLIMNNADAPSSTVLADWNSQTGQFKYRNDLSSPLCLVSSTDRTKTLIGTLGGLGVYDASSDTLTASVNQYGCGAAIGANANGTQFATSINSGGKTTLVLLDTHLNVQQQIPMGISQFRNMGIVYGRNSGVLYFIQYDVICNHADITTIDTTALSVLGSSIFVTGGECNSSLQEAPLIPLDENNVLYISVGGSIAVTPTAQTSVAVTPGWRSLAPPTGFTGDAAALSVGGNAPQVAYMVRNGGPQFGGAKQQVYFYGEQYFENVGSTIGAATATVDWTMNAEEYFTALSPWMEAAEIKTPPSGAPGLTSVGISTPSGTSTVQNAYISVPGKVVQVTGALWKLIYDRTRQRLYISNATANRVEVYSLASQQFLTPIPVGNSPHGLALTPDGSQLVVANSGDGTVTVVNPDNPSLPTTISLGPSGSGQPNEIVTTNNGKALVDYVGPLQIDLTTHALTSFPNNHIYSVQSLAADQQGSTVLCGCGAVGLWNPQTGTWYFNLLRGTENGAISGDGTTIAQGNYIATPQLTITGRIASWDFTTAGLSVTGNSATLNATGSLLYMTDNGTADSFGSGLQVFDRNHGDLKEWITLTEPVSNYSLHQITLDDTGQNVYILTKSGFTIVNLPFVPMSVAHLAPNTGSALGGTAVTVRGSGFVAGSVVRLNGASVDTQFVDSQTLSIITPALPVGPIQLSVQNPDGQSYSLDNVFAAQ